MKLLITGGAGYIGSHTTRLLAEEGHACTVLDDLSTGHRQAVGAGRLVEADLLDCAALNQVFAAETFDAVVHFAAAVEVGESVENPCKYYEINTVGTLNLLSAMREAGVRRIVFSSTAAVYGEGRERPLVEDDATVPVNPYGRSKLACEWVLEDARRAYGLGFAALRYFNAAGAWPDGSLGEDHDPETHLIPRLIRAALDEEPALIYGDDYPTRDGTCVRDYVHVMDIAQAHILALERVREGDAFTLNIGSGDGATVREVVDAVREVTGIDLHAKVAERRAGDPAVLVASPERIQEELGWRPGSGGLREIVASAWQWHSTHPNGF